MSAEQFSAHAALFCRRCAVADAGDAAGDSTCNHDAAESAGRDDAADSAGRNSGSANSAARAARDAVNRRAAGNLRPASHGGGAEAAPGAAGPSRHSRADSGTATAGAAGGTNA